MKKIIYIALSLTVVLCLTSCEGCVKKMAKKATSMSLSAVEGVAEAFNEHGEAVSEKATDALGAVVKGAGKSIDKLLDAHAENVAEVAGRTLVQTIDGLDKSLTEEYYENIAFIYDYTDGVNLELFGRIKSTSVIDAYFSIPDMAAYDAKFVFVSDAGEVLMTKDAGITRDNTDINSCTVVSFALDGDEMAKLARTDKVRVSIRKK